ncbi:MAG: ABC transporter permease [Euryarchaeota archaeon]|nr:ABC transporter permease [Euryarchaeota archaeon]MDE1837343.1 ABC transporter permease [Euryarchaeota archaeon]MDE1880925.1 ABC transporter permease [Euryarchaeota archaeon]MDE2045621.1 ABC transporter permease [Thermoplasmata archaeon]
MTNRMGETVHFALFHIHQDAKDPTGLLFTVIISFLPVMFLLIFIGTAGAIAALPGVLVFALTGAGIAGAPIVYWNRVHHHIQDFLVSSPMRPASFAVGTALYATFLSSPSLVMAAVALAIFVPLSVQGVLLAMAALLLLWTGMLFVGFSAGLAAKSVTRVNQVGNLVGLALGLLPPVYYPLDRLPPFWRPIALLAPTTDAAQVARAALGFGPIPLSQEIFAFGYLGAFAGLAALLSLRYAHWVEP